MDYIFFFIPLLQTHCSFLAVKLGKHHPLSHVSVTSQSVNHHHVTTCDTQQYTKTLFTLSDWGYFFTVLILNIEKVMFLTRMFLFTWKAGGERVELNPWSCLGRVRGRYPLVLSLSCPKSCPGGPPRQDRGTTRMVPGSTCYAAGGTPLTVPLTFPVFLPFSLTFFSRLKMEILKLYRDN